MSDTDAAPMYDALLIAIVLVVGILVGMVMARPPNSPGDISTARVELNASLNVTDDYVPVLP